MKTPASGNQNHFIALDSLRGMAAIVITMFHVEWPNYITHNRFVGSGYLMVDFFFVLSGFVIAFNYLNRIEGAASVGRFVWLRFWRLYPLHLFMLLVYVLIEILKYAAQQRYGIVANEAAFSRNNGWSLVLQLLMAHGLFPFSIYSFNNVSWSISLEFYAYLFFAVTVLTRRPIWLAVAIAAGAAIAIIEFDYPFIARCLYGFFIGVVVSRLFSRLNGWVTSYWLGAEIIPPLAFILVVASVLYDPHMAFILLPLASGLLILSMTLFPDGGFVKLLTGRILVGLGMLSYSIYMTHAAILWGFNQLLRAWIGRLAVGSDFENSVSPLVGTVLVLVFLGITLVVSRITYTLIESPCRSWSKRIMSRTRMAPSPKIREVSR